MTVRIKTGDEKVLRVILAYGPQENEDIEKKKKFFDDLNVEITRCKIACEDFILVGDLNAKLDPSDYKYEDLFTENLSIPTENVTLNVHNHDAKCSSNGTLLTDIIIIKKQKFKTFEFH